MIVYVVLERNRNTDFEYCGVYGTREQAENRIEELIKEFSLDINNLYIEEVEIKM